MKYLTSVSNVESLDIVLLQDSHLMCFLIFNKTLQSNFSVRRNDGSFDLANELD